MITFKFRCIVIVIFFILTLPPAIYSASVPFSAPRKGMIDGVTFWTLPRTNNGLQPIQSWHDAGSSPDGDIYVSGMDHLTNAALYCVHNDTLRYVGDAKSASQAANNWKSDEYAQKFHTRAAYLNGRLYVAVLNRSYFTNEYLTAYPGKWYAYDIAKQTFTDISASQPGGITIAIGGFVTLAVDYKLNFIYGAVVPTGGIVRYDALANKFTDLGRPSAVTQQYVYINRFMWVDSRSRLYFTGGGWSQPDPPTVFKHVHYYDPSSGFGDMQDWPLAIIQAIEMGQWNRMHTRCYMCDDHGNIYRFDDAGPSWTLLSSIGSYVNNGSVWVFHLSADEKKVYIGTALGAPEVLLEYDIATKSVRQLCQMSDLGKPFGDANRHTGYDAWDPDGRFCFTGFKGLPNEQPPGDSVLFARVDPVRLKVAKGFLPALVEANADTIRQSGNRGFMVSRTGGSTANAQEILFTVKAVNQQNEVIFTYNDAITIPAGSSNTLVPLSSLSIPDSLKTSQLRFAVVPNGNDYVAGMNKTASLGSSLTAVRQSPFIKGDMSTFKMTFIRNTAVYFEFSDFQERNVPITIMDIHGAVINKIVSGPASNGTYRASWNLTGFNGQRVIPGVYFTYCGNVHNHRQIIVMQ